MLNYQSMENRWGVAAAHQYLTEVEKASGIASWQMADVDPETRLENAIQVQDSILRSKKRAA